MRIRVLGAAAGGGYPQWNCGCPNCRDARGRPVAGTPRTQASIAISADGDTWFLIGATPDVRVQIESFSALHPRAIRHSPIAGIVLTNGDLDHCLGLLCLREETRLHVYATPRVHQGFTEGNSFSRTLERVPEQVVWHALTLEVERSLLTAGGEPTGLSVTAIPIPGKVPLHWHGRLVPDPEDNVGLLIRETDAQLMVGYFPTVGQPTAQLTDALTRIDCLFFDGTFWSSDELVALGIGTRCSEEMAHWPVGGPDGSLRLLRALPIRRRVLIHINNTNPLLRDDSPARQEVRAAGIEVAYDGMEFDLCDR